MNVSQPDQGVPDEILNPTWTDKAAYDEAVKKLAQKFVNNFKKFEDKVPKSVLEMAASKAKDELNQFLIEVL